MTDGKSSTSSGGETVHEQRMRIRAQQGVVEIGPFAAWLCDRRGFSIEDELDDERERWLWDAEAIITEVLRRAHVDDLRKHIAAMYLTMQAATEQPTDRMGMDMIRELVRAPNDLLPQGYDKEG